MNCVYFLCRDHGEYVDAGYRWAYWQLEHTGIVELGAVVDVPSLLNAKDYWNFQEKEQSSYLDDLLPRVRRFLNDHSGHQLLYVDEDWLHQKWELGYEYKELES